jgi:hypothetical protein
MVLLSFSVKEAELKAGTKIRTTRLYTPEKWRQWQATVPPNATKLLDLWWKPRRLEGYFIDKRPGADLYRLRFTEFNTNLDGFPWPCKVDEARSDDWALACVPMTDAEAIQWVREEGFEGDFNGLVQFFIDHYAPLVGKVFQSIAFPRTVV